MKRLFSIIKKEFLDLLRNRSFVHILFVGFLLLDGFSFLYPQYFTSKLIAFIFFPFILIIYCVYAAERKVIFIAATVLNALGECLFSNTFENYNPIGLIFHGFSLFIYAYMLFSLLGLIKLRVIAKFSIPMVLFIWLPTWIFSRGMNSQNMFKEALFYVFSVTLYVFSVFALNSSIRLKYNLYALASAFFLITSAYVAGYNVFVHRNSFSILVGDFFFYLSHYLICWFFVVYCKPESV